LLIAIAALGWLNQMLAGAASFRKYDLLSQR
jgi:hypothetical protein